MPTAITCNGQGGYWREDAAGLRFDPCLGCHDCYPRSVSGVFRRLTTIPLGPSVLLPIPPEPKEP